MPVGAANDSPPSGRQLELVPGFDERPARRTAVSRSGSHLIDDLKKGETGKNRKLIARIQEKCPGDPLRQVDMLVNQANIEAATGRKRELGVKSYKAYRWRLRKCVNDLARVNRRVQNISEFGRSHVQALVALWERDDASVAYMQNLLTALRRLCLWIGKPDAAPRIAFLVSDPLKGRRSYAAAVPRTLSAKGVDPQALCDEMEKYCPVTALQMRLMDAFGLRVEEAVMFRPAIADKGQHIVVSYGTKGGRSRVVPVETVLQREMLERAKAMASDNAKGVLAAKPRMKLHQAINHFRYLCKKKIGLTKKDLGCTPHGFRHEYANKIYQQLTGVASPVLGGPQIDRAAHLAAELDVSERLGHARGEAAKAYIGGHRVLKDFSKKNVLAMASRFKGPEVVAALQGAGITRLQVLGGPADGKPMGDVVICAWDGPVPVTPHESNAPLLAALAAAVGRPCLLVHCNSPAANKLSSFEVF
jgi:integrase